MGKKNMWALVVVIIVILAAGGYAIFHKSSKPAATTTSTTSSTKSTTSTETESAVITTKTNSTVGSYLADTADNALYTNGTGSTGVTNCSGSCLSAWPIYQDSGSTTGLPTNVGTIKRSDNGEIQYTYKGMPLYYFSSDARGQVTGNGVSGFSVAKP